MNGKVVVLTDVPQGACPNCGSRVYKAEVLERIETLMKGARVKKANAKGNLVKDSDVTVSVRLVRSTGGVVMNGGARAIADGGVRFDMLTVDRAQMGYALRAESSSGYQVESNLFEVTP